MPDIPDLAAFVGHIVAFVGVDDSYESQDRPDVAAAMADKAKAAGIDTLVFRRGNGTLPLPSEASLRAEKDAVHGAGVGWLPYAYCYGPKFGDNQVAGECAHLAALSAINGAVVADLEIEWDGQFHAAQYFERLMRPVPCKLIVTSWANPYGHNFPNAALAPAVDAWVPQDYDNWLVAQTWQQVRTETVRFPALDLTQEFGANNFAANAAQLAAPSIWLWDYAHAIQQAPAIQQIRKAKGWLQT
jgi:hypothetical protein